MSVGKIHINSSTSMTLNDRFTVIQSSGQKIDNSTKRISQRVIKNSPGMGNTPKVSLANRRFLQRLEQKHKIQTALKLKRRSLKTNLPAKQRIRNRAGLKKGVSKAIRLTPSGKFMRSNSLSNIATMKADLFAPALKRSNSVSNIVTRLGSKKLMGKNGTSQLPRRQLKRPEPRQRQARSRSRSVSNLRRSNSKLNLRQLNTRQNLNRVRDVPQKINRNNFPNQRKRKLSVNGRFVGRPNNPPQRRQSQSGNGPLQNRAPFKRRNSTTNANNRSGVKQGRISRPRGRNDFAPQRGGRSRSRSRVGNNSVQQNRRGGRARNQTGGNRGNQQGRGRNRNQVRGGRAQKVEIKKEDLDKELDQYMANTKTALDKDMDAYMTGSDI